MSEWFDPPYGTHYLTYSEADHVAGWGARLIFREVEDGGSGLVPDRQSGIGDESIVEQRIFPHVDAFMDKVREAIKDYRLDSASNARFDWSPPDDPAIHFCASPQSSYGYIYLTAVADKSTRHIAPAHPWHRRWWFVSWDEWASQPESLSDG